MVVFSSLAPNLLTLRLNNLYLMYNKVAIIYCLKQSVSDRMCKSQLNTCNK